MVVVLWTLAATTGFGPALATRQAFLGQHCLPPGYGDGSRKCDLKNARLPPKPARSTAAGGHHSLAVEIQEI